MVLPKARSNGVYVPVVAQSSTAAQIGAASKGTLTALQKTSVGLEPPVAPPDRTVLTSVSVRVDEAIDDTATTLVGPFYAEVWLMKGGVSAVLLDAGWCYGGFGQVRAVVGFVGRIEYAGGDKLFIALNNETAGTPSYRIDYTYAHTGSVNMEGFTPLSTMKGPQKGPKAQAQSIPDQKPYDLTLDLMRRMPVSQLPWWVWYPTGRVVDIDDLEIGIADNWIQDDGTRALVTTHGHSRKNALSLVTGGTAGDQCAIHKSCPLIADQATSDQSRVIVGCWFSPWGSTTWRDFQLTIEVDDLLQLRTAKIRAHRDEATVAQDDLDYLDDGDAWATISTNQPIGDDYAWHFIGMELDHLQGVAAAGYLKYQSTRLDDHQQGLAGVAGLQGASNGIKVTKYGATVTTDSNDITTVYVTDLFLLDNSNAMGL